MADAVVSNVVVIGSGPAGYAAAVYLGRARLAPTLVTGYEVGGQLMYTTDVENYPGFAEGVAGPKLMMAMQQQAARFGTSFVPENVTSIAKADDGTFTVHTDNDTVLRTRAVLIATGASARMLGLPNESELLGKGLSVCAVCDAAFYGDKVTYVVGGGDSAMEDALALTKFASQVFLVHRRDSFRASRIMQERVLNNPKIAVVWNSSVAEIKTTSGKVTGVVIENLQTKAREERVADGVFYAIGHIPATEFAKDVVQRSEEGYIVTTMGLDAASVALAQQHLDENGKLPYLSLTTTEGIFAAGDCVDFRYRQAVTAAAYGTQAALDVERWLERSGTLE